MSDDNINSECPECGRGRYVPMTLNEAKEHQKFHQSNRETGKEFNRLRSQAAQSWALADSGSLTEAFWKGRMAALKDAARIFGIPESK